MIWKPFWIQRKWWEFWAWLQGKVQNHYLKDKLCESCGQPATVLTPEDMSVWCAACDAAAKRLGYDNYEEN